jgi:hypothetical protein
MILYMILYVILYMIPYTEYVPEATILSIYSIYSF